MTSLSPELSDDERLMAIASAAARRQPWCPLCWGWGMDIRPFGWCPRIHEAGHGRYLPRRMWDEWPPPFMEGI